MTIDATNKIYTTSMPSSMSLDDVYSEWKYQTIDMLNSLSDTDSRTKIESLTTLGEVAFESALGMKEEQGTTEQRLEDLQGSYYDLEELYLKEKANRKAAEHELSELRKTVEKYGEINLNHSIEVGIKAVTYLTHMDHIMGNVYRLVSSDKKDKSLMSLTEHLKAVDRLGRDVSKNWENTEIYKSLKLAIDDVVVSSSIVKKISENVSDATSALAMPLHPALDEVQLNIAKNQIKKKLQESSLTNLKVGMDVIGGSTSGRTNRFGEQVAKDDQTGQPPVFHAIDMEKITVPGTKTFIATADDSTHIPPRWRGPVPTPKAPG